MNIWYLDDGTLADYPEVVLSDFKKVRNLSQEIGLELNFNKEVIPFSKKHCLWALLCTMCLIRPTH
jgi:hypothetical protein